MLEKRCLHQRRPLQKSHSMQTDKLCPSLPHMQLALVFAQTTHSLTSMIGLIAFTRTEALSSCTMNPAIMTGYSCHGSHLKATSAGLTAELVCISICICLLPNVAEALLAL